MTRANKTLTRKIKTWTQLRSSEMVGQDGHRISLARLSIHGAGHQTQEALEARRSRHQSIGQTGQTTRHRLQSGQEFTRQVESRRQDDQGHRQVTGQQNLARKDRQEVHASQEKARIVKRFLAKRVPPPPTLFFS